MSEHGKDFLRKCFVRDPRKRWTAEMLLNHHFISETECLTSTKIRLTGCSSSISRRLSSSETLLPPPGFSAFPSVLHGYAHYYGYQNKENVLTLLSALQGSSLVPRLTWLAPRSERTPSMIPTTLASTLTSTMRMINRIHSHSSNYWSSTQPPNLPSLPELLSPMTWV
ncbi:hypothetical protein CFP56_017575 [Quercus suber]|uniref:Protein kinase domain-containing protein n=1 Tax=Quercus suber TaxID=58331 RepID=A0AAW0KL06_QUESU